MSSPLDQSEGSASSLRSPLDSQNDGVELSVVNREAKQVSHETGGSNRLSGMLRSFQTNLRKKLLDSGATSIPSWLGIHSWDVEGQTFDFQ